jgi:hypothetical protein
MSPLNLDWKEEDDGYYAETPYGKAIVTKVRNSEQNRRLINISHYAARIEQPDGSTIDVPHLLDSPETAKWLLFERLQKLAKRNDEPKELTSALRTLAVCRQLLNEADNARHLETIDLIEHIVRKYYGL